jgi:DNA repair exonuclease SbcCD nuclease subunit
MNTKFLFFTDPHVTAVAPIHRVDDYSQSILSKIREAYEMAASQNCEFVVLGGDLFNVHRLFSYELINDLMEIICDSGLNTYAVVGQHDIHGYNPETFKSSTLAFVTKHCSRLNILWEPTEVKAGVFLYPSHVWEDVNLALNPAGLNPANVNILVAHHLITDQKKMFDTVSTSLFKDGPYDVVVSGDLHCGFEPHQLNGHWFCNPGSLARRASDEADRVPMVAVIGIEKGKRTSVDQYPLSVAKPGGEVFGQEAMAIINKAKEDFDPTKFLENVDKFEMDVADIHELIQKVGGKEKIEPRVLAYLASKKT